MRSRPFHCTCDTLLDADEIVSRMLPGKVRIPTVQNHTLLTAGIDAFAHAKLLAVFTTNQERSHRVCAKIQT
ncbi:MAG: hypothetical protein BWY82_01196 [Verrucomicrobia bacterium ADurb.Bin474]|nr:MAG: hypothetical protein BWY82_01196 [Verrucomicrobia bacterium ADurb.Bin474]